MSKRWFYRLLFSYLPILFLIISLLIFFSFFTIRSLTHKEMVQANEMFSRNVLQHLNNPLQNIDQMILEEIMNNPRFRTVNNLGCA